MSQPERKSPLDRQILPVFRDESRFVRDNTRPSLRPVGATEKKGVSEEDLQRAREAAVAEPEVIETFEAPEPNAVELTGAGIIDRLQRTINNPKLDLRMLQVTDKGMSVEAFAQSIIDRYTGTEQINPDGLRKQARQYRETLDSRMESLRSITNIERLSQEQIKQLKDDVSRGIVATVLESLVERTEDETPTIVMRPERAPQVTQLAEERAQLLVDCGIAELPMELDKPIDINSQKVRTALQTMVGKKEHELREKSPDGAYLLSEEGEAVLDAYEQELQDKLQRIGAIDKQQQHTPEQPMTPSDMEHRRDELLAFFNMTGMKEPINPASLLFRAAKKERRDAAIRGFQAQGMEGETLRERIEQFETEELGPRADELLLIDQSLQDKGMLTEQGAATRLGIRQEKTPSVRAEVPKEEIAALQERRQEIMNELGIRLQDATVDTASATWKKMVRANRAKSPQERARVNDLGKELETIDYRLNAAGAPLLVEDAQDKQWFNERPTKRPSAAAQRAQLRKQEQAAINPSAERRPIMPRTTETATAPVELRQMQEKLATLQHTMEELMKDEQAILASLSGWKALMAKVREPDILRGVRRQIETASLHAAKLTKEISQFKQEVQPATDTAPTLSAVRPVAAQAEFTPKPRTTPKTEIIPKGERPPVIDISLLEEVADDELEATPPLPETRETLRERRLAILNILGLDTDPSIVGSDQTDKAKLKEALVLARTTEDRRLRERAMRKVQQGIPRLSVSIGEDMYRYEQWLTGQAKELLDIERRLANQQSQQRAA